MEKSNWISFVITCVVIAILLFIIYIVISKPVTPPVIELTPITACEENETRTDKLGDVYTCIQGQWIYTGTNNSNKG